MLRVVCISDTHGRTFHKHVPDGDVLIHCGDGAGLSANSTEKLNDAFGKLPHEYKIYVPGNHDGFIYEAPDEAKNILYNAQILIEEEITVKGIRIYGSPYTPLFQNWFFMHPHNSAELAAVWKKVPNFLDILVTHGPPFSILDSNQEGYHCGCELLYTEITERIKPRYHIFGHIHEGFGQRTPMGSITTFINCAFVDRGITPSNYPVVIDV